MLSGNFLSFCIIEMIEDIVDLTDDVIPKIDDHDNDNFNLKSLQNDDYNDHNFEGNSSISLSYFICYSFLVSSLIPSG